MAKRALLAHSMAKDPRPYSAVASTGTSTVVIVVERGSEREGWKNHSLDGGFNCL